MKSTIAHKGKADREGRRVGMNLTLARRRHRIDWFIAIVVTAIAAICLAGCSSTGSSQGSTQLRQESYPIMMPGSSDSGTDDSSSSDNSQSDSKQMNLYFVGDGDIPYVSISEFMTLFGSFYKSDSSQIPEVEYDITQKGSVTTVSRPDNGTTMTVDASKDTIDFPDFDTFMQSPGGSSLLNIVTVGPSGVGGSDNLLKTGGKTYNRKGNPVTFDLAAYSIDIIESNGECYLPLQTAADVLPGRLGACIVFNGEKVFISGGSLENADDFYSASTGKMSEGFAQFNYNELRFLLDTFYGLKSQHSIDSFESLFNETGLKEGLSSTDPAQFEAALFTLINLYFDDGHSAYVAPSYLVGQDSSGGGDSAGSGISDDGDTKDPQQIEDLLTGESIPFGESVTDYIANHLAFNIARRTINPGLDAGDDKGLFSYEEVGNTAIVTFDAFTTTGKDYRKDADLDNPQDTIELVACAHKQIMREGSPIENVVIDLSCNGGGAVDAAAFLAAWCKGAASLNLRNALTGAQDVASFNADVNLDGVFDVNDVLPVNIRVYCLISPQSFSCGNLVPAIFKGSPRITLIGRASGGGTCVVQPCTTACGTMIQISGNTQISTVKNGSFYDIDKGIEPDFGIDKAETFYNREQLVDFINSLK